MKRRSHVLLSVAAALSILAGAYRRPRRSKWDLPAGYPAAIRTRRT